MKLEQLALLLKKDAKELAGSLNVQEGEEVSPDKTEKLLTEQLKIAELQGISEGKKQAEGRAKREVLQSVEKVLKERFEITGDGFDEMVEQLSLKVNAKPIEVKDDKVLKERDAWKQKAEKEAAEKEVLKKQFEKIEKLSEVKQKLTPLLGRYEFPTEKVKQIAIDQFTEANDFLITDGQIFILQDGKPIGTFDTIAEKHFRDFGKVIEKGVPPARDGKPDVSYGETQKELMESLRKAKTPEEKNTIMQRLKVLDKQLI